MEPIFFASPEEFRAWLHENHDKATEVFVGLYKKGSGKPSLSWSQLVDQALCYGWIDGKANTIDDERWVIRVTPRKPNSNWSAVNLKKIEELTKQGLMHESGLKVYEARSRDKEQRYTSENPVQELPQEYAARLVGNPQARAFFEAQAPSYQRGALWWVMSAKQDATRERRLERLIDDSANGKRIDAITPRAKRKTE